MPKPPITPEQARALLDAATPGPWHVHTRDRHIDGETETWLYVGDTPALTVDHNLMSAAPDLAAVVAGLRVEYAVRDRETDFYLRETDDGRLGDTTYASDADWWPEMDVAADLANSLSKRCKSEFYVVARYVTETWEVEA